MEFVNSLPACTEDVSRILLLVFVAGQKHLIDMYYYYYFFKLKHALVSPYVTSIYDILSFIFF